MAKGAKKPATPTKTYAKVPLSVDDALNHLWQRRLMIDDRPTNARDMRSIGYFRLHIYMRRFQNPATKHFWPRTRFTDIVELYDFDRRLRSVTMDAVERVEVALRSALSNPIALTHGSHWYADRSLYGNLRGYASALAQISRECEKKKGLALTHYHETYAVPDLPPVWLVCEHLTLGSLSRLFDALTTGNRKTAGRHVWPDLPDPLLVSWLHSLTDLRNACAHHSRLWNVKLPVSAPQQPKSAALAGYAAGMQANWTYYARAVMIKALLDPLGYGAEWRESLKTTLASCRHVDASAHLGFPSGWETAAAWV
jgi:abortive infection bacteriophage resistance protein